MKIFVCEFVTGGGLYRELLPASLAQEGGCMLETLLADLSELPHIGLLTTRDARLPPLQAAAEVVQVSPEQDVWAVWQQCLAETDAFWPIAPESGGVLARISALAIAQGKTLLGSAPAAVEMAASKAQTSAQLTAAGLTTVATWRAHQALPAGDGPWVAKPDDGIGCEDSRLFHDAGAMHAWLEQKGRRKSHIIQPYLAGEAGSISMLCARGQAWLLSCNRQLIELEDAAFHYYGSVLNGMREHWDAFERIARQVAAAMPDLAGYVGIDVLVDGSEITVLEVNPRLTTSYAGLHRAMGCNPARLVVDLLYNGAFIPPPVIERNIVEVRLNEQ